MKAIVPALTICLTLLHAAAPQEKKTTEASKRDDEKKIADLRRRAVAEVEVDDLQDEITFRQFLERFSKKCFPVRLDEEVFKDDSKTMMQSSIKFPAFPKRMAALTMLRIALDQVLPKDLAMDFRYYPTHLAITSPERAIVSRTYDVSALVKERPYLLKKAKTLFGAGDLAAEIPAGFVVDSIPSDILHAPIEIRNHALVMQSNDNGHRQVESVLAHYRRLAELRVLANARLYEIDEDLFHKELAPVLGKKRAARAGAEVVKLLKEQKLIAKGHADKFHDGEKVACLSLHRFVHARPKTKSEGIGSFGVSHDGVTFFIETELTREMRGMRLQLFEESARVVEMRTKKVRDLTIDKEVEVVYPDIRKKTLTATLEIDDLQHVIMDVDYRPFPAPAEKRWVLMLQPRIYIEGEHEF